MRTISRFTRGLARRSFARQIDRVGPVSAQIRYSLESLEQRVLLTAITSGQTIAGTIATSGQQDTYTFTANAGDTVELSVGDPTSASNYRPDIILNGPANTQVAASGTAASNTSANVVYAVPANGAGGYTVIVQSTVAADTGAYDLEMAKAPGPQAADSDGDGGTIVSGQTVTGAINRPGDLDVFTFGATAGQTFQLTLGVASSASTFLPLLRIYNPNGAAVSVDGTAAADSSTTETYQVPSTGAGTYTAVVQSYTVANVGAYALELGSAPATQAADSDGDGGAIVSGQTKTGMINRPGDFDVFTFSATAGQTFQLSLGVASSASTFQPYLRIYDPNGTAVSADGTPAADSSTSDTYHVPSNGAGTYTAVVQGYTASDTGAYALELGSAPATQAADADGDGGTIVSGQTKTGMINRPGDFDVFTFSATAGQTFELSLGVASSSSTFEPYLRIYDPNGTAISNDGTPAADSSTNDVYHVPSTAAGTYTAVVQSYTAGNIGAYALELASAPATQATDADGDGGAIVSGQTITGAINRPGDLDVFTFSATAGQTFQLSLGVATPASTFLPYLYVYDGNGTQVSAGGTPAADSSTDAIYHVPSTAAGIYTAVVQSYNATNVGAYALELASAPATQATDSDGNGGAIVSGQTKLGTISRPGDVDVFTFAATAGQTFELSLGVASAASTFLPYLRIYDPNGSAVSNGGTPAANSSTNDSYHVPSNGAGTYTVVVQSYNATNIGAYALELAMAPATQAADADGDGGTIVSGQTKTGIIGRPGDVDVFTFTATAGQTFQLSLGVATSASTFLPYLYIYDPNGTQISADGTPAANTSTGFVYHVPSTGAGTYTAFVQGYTAGNIGAYALELASANATQVADSDGDGGTMVSGQTSTGMINRPGDLDVYTINAVAGETLQLSLGVANAASTFLPFLYIYDPNGTQIYAAGSPAAGSTITDTYHVPSNAAGTYTAVVRGYTAANTGGYTLGLALVLSVTPEDSAGNGIAAGSASRGQRSMETQIAVVFDEPVSLTAGAFNLNLVNNYGNGTNNGAPDTALAGVFGTPTNPSGDGITWIIPIISNGTNSYALKGTHGGISGASLNNGVYDLNVNEADVTSVAHPSAALSGNFVSSAWHRLFGDVDNARRAFNTEYSSFLSAFSSTFASSGGTNYNADLDYDGDGRVFNSDYSAFLAAFGSARLYTEPES